MKNAIITIPMVLGICLGLLAACSGISRQKVESAEDKACADIARIRVWEIDAGINPPDSGEAGAKP